MSVTDYRTVSSSDPATLVTEVKKLITAGWQPLSGHVAGYGYSTVTTVTVN